MPCSVSIAAQVVIACGSLCASFGAERRREQKARPGTPNASGPAVPAVAVCMAMLYAASYQVCQVWRGHRQLLLSRKRRAQVGFKAATPRLRFCTALGAGAMVASSLQQAVDRGYEVFRNRSLPGASTRAAEAEAEAAAEAEAEAEAREELPTCRGRPTQESSARLGDLGILR